MIPVLLKKVFNKEFDKNQWEVVLDYDTEYVLNTLDSIELAKVYCGKNNLQIAGQI